jgi:hypothetical protein
MHAGRFEARIGISGNKHVYLGLYNKEPDAAKAYDRAVVRIKGSQASTNFTLSDYNRELTEHELKQVEMQIPHAFRALELTSESRAASGSHLPLAEELEALDLKALSCASLFCRVKCAASTQILVQLSGAFGVSSLSSQRSKLRPANKFVGALVMPSI